MVSSMQSTANMTRSRPSVLGGGSCWSALNAAGVRYLVSSSLLWPPRGCASSRCHSGRRRGRRCGQPRGLRSAPSFRLLTELGKRTRSRVQVVDSEGDLVHPLNGHVSELTVPLRPCWRTCRRGGFASPRPLVQLTWKSCVTPPPVGASVLTGSAESRPPHPAYTPGCRTPRRFAQAPRIGLVHGPAVLRAGGVGASGGRSWHWR